MRGRFGLFFRFLWKREINYVQSDKASLDRNSIAMSELLCTPRYDCQLQKLTHAVTIPRGLQQNYTILIYDNVTFFFRRVLISNTCIGDLVNSTRLYTCMHTSGEKEENKRELKERELDLNLNQQ